MNRYKQINVSEESSANLNERDYGVLTSTEIYRYMSVEHFLDLVETKELVMSHISKWEDPFEAYLLRSNIDYGKDADARNDFYYELLSDVYGQSWTTHGDESDVRWRSY